MGKFPVLCSECGEPCANCSYPPAETFHTVTTYDGPTVITTNVGRVISPVIEYNTYTFASNDVWSNCLKCAKWHTGACQLATPWEGWAMGYVD